MTDENTRQPGKAPTFIAYYVKERGDEENHWMRIGAVWPHADGKGGTLQLESLPIGFDGRITYRVPPAKSN